MCVNMRVKLFLFAFVAVLSTGCATVDLEPQFVALDNASKKEFVFKSTRQNGEPVSEQVVIKAIRDQIEKQSRYDKQKRRHSGSGGLYDVRGIDVQSTANKIYLRYINGEYYSSTQNLRITKIELSYDVKIEKTENLITAIVSTPESYQVVPGRSPIFTTYKPMLSNMEIQNDIAKINDGMMPQLAFSEKVSGEVDVKYSDESVYANFKRLLGDYKYRDDEVKKYDIAKDKVFSLVTDGSKIPVKVAVFPYRNGSKVTYEFFVNYLLNNDGTSTYSEQTVNQYIAKLEKVAND